MRIAIDGSCTMFGGSATYMHNILPNLAKLDQENEYIVICTQDQADWTVELPENFQYVRIPLCSGEAGKRIWWMQTRLPGLLKEYDVDVLYSPNDQTPFFASCPSALAVRNSNPYADLKTVGGGLKNQSRLLLLKQMSRISAWKASKVIFVSESSRKVICSKLGISDEKGVAIYHGIGEQFRLDAMFSPRFKKHLPYVLSVSTIYQHKNYVRLIKAFARLIKQYGLKYNLLIAGRVCHTESFKQMKQTIASENVNSCVHLLGEVEYTQMPALYSGAYLFVFPSYRETFGHPLIEAMASGVPVVSSNVSAMPEICADAALYFDPLNPDDIADAMHKLLTDNMLWEIMRHRGLKRAKEFSWAKTAQKTLDVLQSIRTS